MFNKSSIIMKQFKNLILAGALVLGLAGFAVSCDKYGDDIDELTSRVGKLETQLTDLQTKIDAGVIVTGVTQTAGGVTIQTSNGTYTITNGEKGEKGEKGDKGDQGEKGQGSVVTLGENGNWFIDGVDTKIPYKGEKGDKGEDGKASVVEIGENGNWFIDGVDTGVKAGADGALSAVWNPETGTLTLKNVEGYEGDYVLNLTAAGVTSVELVASIDGANITNKINFATVTEKENVFGIVDPEDGKTLLPGGLKFTEGAETQRDVNVIVRVSPVNYALKAEDISFQNGNGETLDWVKVVSVEPYKRLYTRAGEPETGLWKIKVALAKDYVKKDFEAVTKVGKKNVLFAVKAQDAVSTYDVAFVYEVPKPLSKLEVVVDNDHNINGINNRYYGVGSTTPGRLSGQNYYTTSKSFADGKEKIFNYKEKAWAADTAYTATASSNFVEATGKTTTDKVNDNRNSSPAYEAFKGTPITITIPAFEANGTTLAYDKSGRLIPNENIRAMYVTLDYEACAVESAPSEWVSWNSYTYTGLNEVVEGAETEIIIDSDRAINDFIGFRVYAVNYDGTLVDPDGRAFYVKLGEDTPAVDWNKGTVLATTVMPLANPESAADGYFDANRTPSTEATISLTDITGAAHYTLNWVDDKGNVQGTSKFDIELVSDSNTYAYFTSGSHDYVDTETGRREMQDVTFSEYSKLVALPTKPSWTLLDDNATSTAKLTIYDNVDHALATLTVSMTKEMPTEDPEGAYVFRSELLENGAFYTVLTPTSDKKKGQLAKVETLFEEHLYEGYSQTDYYEDEHHNDYISFETSLPKQNGTKQIEISEYDRTTQTLTVNSSVLVDDKSKYLIDGSRKNATYVLYNYGEITSVTSGEKVYTDIQEALEDLDGKAGWFVFEHAGAYEYYVKVLKVNTVYCTPYNYAYEFGWPTRENLALLKGYAKDYYTAKDRDGKYVHDISTDPDYYWYDESQYKFTWGSPLTLNINYIVGISSLDHPSYSHLLQEIPDLHPNNTTTDKNPIVYVRINGEVSDLYSSDASITNFNNSVTLTFNGGTDNIRQPITATLVIQYRDMYEAEGTIEVPITINPKN